MSTKFANFLKKFSNRFYRLLNLLYYSPPPQYYLFDIETTQKLYDLYRRSCMSNNYYYIKYYITIFI